VKKKAGARHFGYCLLARGFYHSDFREAKEILAKATKVFYIIPKCAE
jgi:hypothetical protein